MKIVYFSLTGQTRRFVKKLGLDSYEVNATNPFQPIEEDYIVVAPTYDIEVTEIINDFIEYGDNQQHLKGVAGGGNRNFADLFVFTAKDLAKLYNVPMIFEFEFSGTDQDVINFKKEVEQIERL
ncbi:class Ib ribonucleoside-diphosphate reductase assembly flavoprotein NrdI [Carnobacterium divergens]|uniref:Ribonucleotide reductase stimulatory protein n=2 Tax=Carnobacterium divergens TaxID=2748 RepID=A0A0R2HWA2_CARDV|nr:class Ib ribonucleoside-diphosphate reductase assembly flavoprotein NrdI [Carnobacterium divergens]ANZ99052.1 ribonucleotide reductase stimulatory protein [Carnobacterium divergens]KRN56978.1 ribonucleotide reductase stimulatory protein [Carnobacterium divergens DSM 20623]MCO6018772.1 class Ib ribonucleoside-diphosphate reductase assembly flavoprotein NrdI [Carnobacterium divergens]MDO0874798.1 class Ib ribonucleoside-diphosphate reductase assembly flavoprotein NrdI [Carnobacterium divergens